MAGVREKNGKCEIRWYEHGRRRSKILDIPYTPAGVRKAERIRDQVQRQGDVTEAPELGKIAQTWLDKQNAESRRNQKAWLNNYWLHLFPIPVDRIRYADVIDVDMSHLAPSTQRHVLGALAGPLQLAKKSRYISDNPALLRMQEIKVDKKPIDPFTRDERDQLLDSLHGFPQLFYAIRFYTGMRPCEVIALEWSDYNGREFAVSKRRYRGVTKERTKNGKPRIVPVHPYIQKLLRAAPRSIKHPQIILTQHLEPYADGTNLAQNLARTMKRLGIRYRSPYNVRHTAACMMLEAGMKPGYCAEILGHDLRTFFTKYAAWVDRDESEAQRKIWEAWA